jgi:integral membrane protein
MIPRTNLGRLRLLAYLEGISFLLLIGVGMPLKYYFETPTPNLYIGMTHGILFIAYCLWVIIVKAELRWSLLNAFWALAASLLPFGTFVADKMLFQKSKLIHTPVAGASKSKP